MTELDTRTTKLDRSPKPNQMRSVQVDNQWGFLFSCGGCQKWLFHEGLSQEAARADFAVHIQIHTGPANVEWSADGFCQAVRL